MACLCLGQILVPFFTLLFFSPSHLQRVENVTLKKVKLGLCVWRSPCSLRLNESPRLFITFYFTWWTVSTRYRAPETGNFEELPFEWPEPAQFSNQFERGELGLSLHWKWVSVDISSNLRSRLSVIIVKIRMNLTVWSNELWVFWW